MISVPLPFSIEMLSSSGESCNSSAARGLAEEGSSKCDACYGEGERFAMEGYDGEDDGPEDYTVVPCLKCGGTGGAECESWTKAMSRRRGVAEPAVHCHPARAGCSARRLRRARTARRAGGLPSSVYPAHLEQMKASTKIWVRWQMMHGIDSDGVFTMGTSTF